MACTQPPTVCVSFALLVQVQFVPNLPRLDSGLRGRDRDEPPRLERSRRQPHSHSSGDLSMSPAVTPSLDVFSAESPRGPVQHIRIRQQLVSCKHFPAFFFPFSFSDIF